MGHVNVNVNVNVVSIGIQIIYIYNYICTHIYSSPAVALASPLTACSCQHAVIGTGVTSRLDGW